MAFDYTGVQPDDAMRLRLIAKRVRELLPTIVPIVIEMGKHLRAAKKLLPHGQFGAYCDEEVRISHKCAQNYMNAARLARTNDPGDLAKLNAGAVYELAAKNAPASVVSAVLADVRAGHPVTEDEVKERISVAKRDSPAEKASAVAPVDEIANLLISSLDGSAVSKVEFFLRSAKKADIKTLCVRLQDASTETASSDLLPLNALP